MQKAGPLLQIFYSIKKKADTGVTQDLTFTTILLNQIKMIQLLYLNVNKVKPFIFVENIDHIYDCHHCE